MIRDFFSKVFTQETFFWILTIAIAAPIFVFLYHYVDTRTERRQEAASEAEQQAIQSEVQRRRAEREKTGNGLISTPHVSPIVPVDSTDPSTDRTSTKSVHVTELPQKISDVPSGRLPAGPYEGMTPEEVKAYEQRGTELDLRHEAVAQKLDDVLQVYLQLADDEASLMLSLFKSLSPQQLKRAREEALKTLPAADVNYFFDDIENKGIEKTDEQMTAESNQILSSQEALDIVYRELLIEYEEIDQKYKDHYGAEKYAEIFGDDSHE